MPRCNCCKDKFTPRQFNQKYCREKDECIKAEIEAKKTASWKVRKKVLRQEVGGKKSLLELTQDDFNAFIRARDKGKNCISCDKPLGDFYDAGHYFGRQAHPGLRFDLDNAHGEHRYCNSFDPHHLIGYTENLPKRIGEERFEALKQRRNDPPKKYTKQDLMELRVIYKAKTKELK